MKTSNSILPLCFIAALVFPLLAHAQVTTPFRVHWAVGSRIDAAGDRTPYHMDTEVDLHNLPIVQRDVYLFLEAQIGRYNQVREGPHLMARHPDSVACPADEAMRNAWYEHFMTGDPMDPSDEGHLGEVADDIARAIATGKLRTEHVYALIDYEEFRAGYANSPDSVQARWRRCLGPGLSTAAYERAYERIAVDFFVRTLEEAKRATAAGVKWGYYNYPRRWYDRYNHSTRGVEFRKRNDRPQLVRRFWPMLDVLVPVLYPMYYTVEDGVPVCSDYENIRTDNQEKFVDSIVEEALRVRRRFSPTAEVIPIIGFRYSVKAKKCRYNVEDPMMVCSPLPPSGCADCEDSGPCTSCCSEWLNDINIVQSLQLPCVRGADGVFWWSVIDSATKRAYIQQAVFGTWGEVLSRMQASGCAYP